MSVSVSVLVAVHNGARYLSEALESVRAQTRPAQEIIVVDDGSSDESAAIAESFAGVRCLREPHRGVAGARNAALAQASGELVAWLDADDRWVPEKLAVQAGRMEAQPGIGMSFTHQRLAFEAGVERPYWVRAEMIEAASPALATCSMMVRRALFAVVGGFDEAKVTAEDTDWIMRAQEHGVQQLMLPEALLWRRVHGANLSTVKPLGKSQVLGLLRGAIGRKRMGSA